MNLPWQIRPLGKYDQRFLWEALYVALWDPPHMPRRPRSVLEQPRIACYVRDWLALPHDLGVVAVSPGHGCMGAVWSRLIPGYREAAYFDDETPQLGIAVLPDFQGQGLGKKLMAHYLALAEKFFPAVSLGVHPENLRAIQVYRQAGFQQFGTGPGNYLHMVLHFKGRCSSGTLRD